MTLLTVAEAALQLGLAPSNIRARLSRHQPPFPAKDRRDSGHPRRLRVLTEEGIRLLTVLLTSAGLSRRRG